MSRWDGQRPTGHRRPAPVPHRMVLIGCAPDGCIDHADVKPGEFLARYVIDGPDGPVIEWSTDPAKAIKFTSQRAAMGTWLRVSSRMPRRPDGQPNRPLTHFTVTIEAWPT